MPQAPLVVPDELAGMIPPTRTALLVIDVQRDFAAPDGAMARAGSDMSRVLPALERIEALVGLARRAGATLAFARVLTRPETDSAALKLLNARKGGDTEDIAICREGEPGAEPWRVAPEAGEIAVAKRLYNAFYGTDLEAQLRSRGVDTLVVVGFSTQCCVDATCRDAFHRDFNLFVVSDATDAYDEDAQRATLMALRESCALITDADAVTAAWTLPAMGEEGAIG
jgi:nicotinamidase-related amidase